MTKIVTQRALTLNPTLLYRSREGRKDKTRRTLALPADRVRLVMVEPRLGQAHFQWTTDPTDEEKKQFGCFPQLRCKYGKVGDFLYAREPWACLRFGEKFGFSYCQSHSSVPEIVMTTDSRAPQWVKKKPWRQARFMPQCAARTWFKITSLAVERLQDITEEEALHEGVEAVPYAKNPVNTWRRYLRYANGSWTFKEDAPSARESFFSLWDALNGEGTAALNPLVWVIGFERCPAPTLQDGNLHNSTAAPASST